LVELPLLSTRRPKIMSNSIHAQTLPWDGGQFRRLDAAVMGGALLMCIAMAYIKLPPDAPKKMIERVIPVAPVVTLAPSLPTVTPPKPPEPKPEPKPEPVVLKTPTQKVDITPKAAQPKAAPRAATPAKPAPKPIQPTQMGSPDKPLVQTVRPAKATTDKNPVTVAATTPKPMAVPSDTPAAVSHSSGPSAAELQAAARKRAQAAVSDTGLGNAISGLTSGSNSKAKPVEGRGLQKGGVEGGKPDVKLNTAASTSKKSGVEFGSATDGDKTGKSTSSLSGRGTKDVSSAQIRDSASSQSAGKSGGDSAPKGKSKRGDVERVMSQAKGRLNNAYKRALDEDPTMQGSITVKLKISANGQVTSASIVSSDLNNSALEAKMLAIIKGMNFDDGEYDTWDDTYRFNFIPQ
jgi:protein TonB